jgi:chromosome segregation ATPase
MNIIEYWREFLSVVTLLVGILAGRKSKDFKTKIDGAGAIAALQKVYDTYLEHNKEITKELIDRVNSLEKHNRDLQKHFNDISFSYSTVMDENRKMEAKYKELQIEYTVLKEAHENLQKEFNEHKRKLK